MQKIVVWIPHRTTGLLGFLLLNTCSLIPALPICHHAQAMRPVCPAPRWAPLPLWLAQPTLRSCLCSSHKANPSPGPPVSFAGAAGGLSSAREHQTLTRTLPRLHSCVSAAVGSWWHINMGPTQPHFLIPCLPGARRPWPGSQGGQCRLPALPSPSPQLSGTAPQTDASSSRM